MLKIKRCKTVSRGCCSQLFFKIGFPKNLPNIHRKTPVFNSHFNNVSGLQACSCIEKYYRHRCFPVSIATFLRTVFSIEYLLWLLSCRLGKEEKESVKQKSEKKFSNERRKWKHFIFNFYLKILVLIITEMQIPLWLYHKTIHSFSLTFCWNFFFWFLRVHFLYFYFVWETEKYLMSYSFSIFRSKDWELLRKTAVCKMWPKWFKTFLQNQS